jgi:hypothetical protein
MRHYRDNWFNIGAVLAMAIAGALTLSHRGLSRSRLFSALNLAALMVHQFEEYSFPGYFPGLLNAGVFKSDKPDRYPLNTNSALIVNAVVGYPFYLLPVLFPKRRSLGLAPVLFGFGQAAFHGIVPPSARRPATAPGSCPPSSCTCPSASTTSARSAPSGHGAGGVGPRGGLHARHRCARDRRADEAAEERGEPLPLHGAAGGTVWQRRLMPPLFTEPPRRGILRTSGYGVLRSPRPRLVGDRAASDVQLRGGERPSPLRRREHRRVAHVLE